MDLPPFDLTDFLPYRLAVASARVSRALSARYQAAFGLTIPEWRVLAHLAGGEVRSVKDITARVEMDKSKVSRAASRLVDAGLLAKAVDPSDARLVALTLTEQGRAVMARLIPMAKAYEAEVLADLGPLAEGLKQSLERLNAR
jgi:DNA-binding MarR family transcriptional regulator